jgi:polysaccharide export outer membrane protein
VSILRRCFICCLACFALQTAWSQKGPEVLLGAGDVLRISVFQNPELSLDARLGEQGEIFYPLLGSVSLQGLTVTAAQDKLAKLLVDGGFVVRPQVSVVVLQVKSSQVSVLGQVGRPGRYPIESGQVRVSEIIASAGGVLSTGSDTVTLVGARAGQTIQVEIDLPAILQKGDRERDVLVAHGDILHVARAPNFFIYGEVQHPGAFRWERSLTLLQAMAQAGGLTLRGTERGIRIHRRDPQGSTRLIEPTMAEMVERDDVIYVPESLF